MPNVTNERHEIKFLAKTGDLPIIQSWIQDSSALFHEQYRPRRVNSLYFDSHNYQCCADNLSGSGNRAKVRLRWYSAEFDPPESKLEIKFKNNSGLGFKKNHGIGGQINLAQTDILSLRNLVRSSVNDEDSFWLDKYPRPTLITSYRRKYFSSNFEDIRVTIDQDIQFYRQESAFKLNTKRTFNVPDLVVVEVKYPPSVNQFAAKTIADIPLRRTRISKYVLGITSFFE
jgi:SPX domain protein involved in polyphosphate accumulation